jgi:type III restriction enzyme
MIMTMQSFSSDDNILNQKNRDNSIMGLSYLEAIGKTRPVLIMDEPQEGMDTANAVERIKY